MANKILNEDNDYSEKLELLIANWVSLTQNKETQPTVADLGAFLKTPNVQAELPYNAKVTDDIINKVSAKRVASGFGNDKQKRGLGGKSSNKDNTNNANNEKRRLAYIKRLKRVVDDLSDDEQEALLRLL